MVTYELSEVAFPTLTAEQIAEFAECSESRFDRHPDGTILFDVGDTDYRFHLIKSGTVAIVDTSITPPQTIVEHGPGRFTGEVSMVTGNPAILRAVTRGETEVWSLSATQLRELLNQCPETSDIILQAFIARRQLLRTSGRFTGLRVIGSRYSRDTSRVRDFLAKNRVLFTWVDLENERDVGELLQGFGITAADTPVVACAAMVVMRNPSDRELADHLGLRRSLERKVFDVAIVGAGPAGLAAAVYGASEGLSTVLLERTAPGGQAGISMRIENYLGFPAGITGGELADRAVLQASKFGAQLSISSPIVSVAFDGGTSVLTLDDGQTVASRCLLIATGADYRRLDVDDCQRFEGAGLCYAATANEASLCRDADVIVVGGGNSAGQAAVFLSGFARKVHVVIRGDDLGDSMSRYLAHRIEESENIEVRTGTRVHRLIGDDHLAAVQLIDRAGELVEIATPALFSFIGAVPRTSWLPSAIETDDGGFVRTGTAVNAVPSTLQRDLFLLETSQPGVFAAGDVRAGSVKRVASAVGEGAMAIKFVHEYLAGA